LRTLRRLGTGVCLAFSLFAVFPSGLAQDKAPVRKIVFREAPKYPMQARQYHLQGIVRLRVVVAADGTVRSEDVLGGNPVLVDAAMKAVADWKWEPSSKISNERVEISFEGED